jgi:hypothetical protein
MKYVYVENSKVVTILDYAGNVPPTVSIYEITDREYNDIIQDPRTHYFDVTDGIVKLIPEAPREKIKTDYENEQNSREQLRFLNDTDWKVLRHMRQKALNEPTTLTEEEYLSLERQRASAAASIVK